MNKDYSIKLVAMVYLLPHCYEPRPWDQNAAKFSFFNFAAIFHNLVDLICLSYLTFQKSRFTFLKK